ncbi:unnamed protein product [Effrenium voratum]|nr:unnamed protein product [Effrenium voratum]
MDDSAIAAMAAALRELGEEFDPSAGFAVVPLTDCPHLSDLPAREVSMDARCSQCLEDEVWICGTCGKVLCSRYKNKHMLEHAEQQGHAIGLSLSDLSFWCFKCNSYLDVFALPKLHALYTAAHVHKVQSGCTGKRPRTEQVAPLNAFTDNVLLRDFGLLEEVDAAVDRAERDLRIREEEMRLYQPRRHKQRIHLARACASAERQTRLILAPFAMTIARENTSRVVDGGEQEKPAYIAWRVDWHFGHCGQVLTDKNLPEHEVVGRVLVEAFTGTEGLSWPRSLRYVEHGADKLAHPGGFNRRLDKLRTLRENLMDRVVREFPVLHVALPQEMDADVLTARSGVAPELSGSRGLMCHGRSASPSAGALRATSAPEGYDVKPTASGTNRAPAPGARPSRTPREATPKLHPHPAFRASQGEERARALAPAPEAGPILQLEILGVTAQDAMSLYNIQLSGCHQPGLAWGEPEKTSSRSSRGDAMF